MMTVVRLLTAPPGHALPYTDKPFGGTTFLTDLPTAMAASVGGTVLNAAPLSVFCFLVFYYNANSPNVKGFAANRVILHNMQGMTGDAG